MFQPDSIWIERGAQTTPLAARVLARLPGVPVTIVDDPRAAEPSGFAAGKRRLVLQRHRGSFLQACPAGTTGLVCCNYLVVNLGSNCPYDCSYCFLQEYIANNPATKVYTNVGEGLAEIGALLDRHPERVFRIGTGELIDSLALDDLTGLSSELVPFFARRPNALLELKTKSATIGGLLELDPNDRTVVSWSMSTAEIAQREEHGTASFAERIAAAAAVQRAGYRVGFHFDPLIPHQGWEESYRAAVEAIFARVDSKRVAWVSLGSLRLTPRLKTIVRERHRDTRILTGELVPCSDGKQRLWRGQRVEMYRRMQAWLQQVDRRMPIYICMEGPGVWQRAAGQVPSDRELASRLTDGFAPSAAGARDLLA